MSVDTLLRDVAAFLALPVALVGIACVIVLYLDAARLRHRIRKLESDARWSVWQ